MTGLTERREIYELGLTPDFYELNHRQEFMKAKEH